jgi:hypothetical protein
MPEHDEELESVAESCWQGIKFELLRKDYKDAVAVDYYQTARGVTEAQRVSMDDPAYDRMYARVQELINAEEQLEARRALLPSLPNSRRNKAANTGNTTTSGGKAAKKGANSKPDETRTEIKTNNYDTGRAAKEKKTKEKIEAKGERKKQFDSVPVGVPQEPWGHTGWMFKCDGPGCERRARNTRGFHYHIELSAGSLPRAKDSHSSSLTWTRPTRSGLPRSTLTMIASSEAPW